MYKLLSRKARRAISKQVVISAISRYDSLILQSFVFLLKDSNEVTRSNNFIIDVMDKNSIIIDGKLQYLCRDVRIFGRLFDSQISGALPRR